MKRLDALYYWIPIQSTEEWAIGQVCPGNLGVFRLLGRQISSTPPGAEVPRLASNAPEGVPDGACVITKYSLQAG
jgi:hypothetical protein